MSADGKSSNILVIGELNVDLVASGMRSEPKLGLEILAETFDVTLGSASAIFACGAARLGERVTFVSMVGDDGFGRYCKDALSARGISTENISVSNRSNTGVTLVMSTAEDRALVTYLGAIAKLSYKDIPTTVFGGHGHLHLTSYFLQTSLRPDFARLMSLAKENGLTTSFDPNSDPAEEWKDDIYSVLEQTGILFLNETEAKQFTGRAEVGDALQKLGDFVPCAVIKLGPNGASAVREGEIVFADGFAIDLVDTTGAGDSFDAGFVHAYLRGKDLKECLRIGNACGALSTTKSGGTPGQPDADQVRELLLRTDNMALTTDRKR